MRYQWAAIFERFEIEPTSDGEIERAIREKKSGSLQEEYGSTVVRAILEEHNHLGNLVWMEVRSG